MRNPIDPNNPTGRIKQWWTPYVMTSEQMFRQSEGCDMNAFKVFEFDYSEVEMKILADEVASYFDKFPAVKEFID